ncbi:MAG TPA: 30S ribosomal protein S12 methylthiotransferase RimO, partial [Candidatus Avacidaminococcus intestinavium]|nr:30S ribosomal protein S12 methylthiotransferase RimO [Candidatus Avacidaminococcus intestinavium]
MKIGLVSLGCPKNLVDSEVMLSLLTNKNMTLTNKPEEADVIIVNTCGFIESAKEESINAILQMGEYKSTGKCRYLLVSGCLAQRYANELFAEMPEIDALIGTACYEEIDRILDKVLAGERVISLVPSKPEEEKNKKITRFITTPAHTAYLKIAEGCGNYCSYCIIPKLRGPYKSRPFEEIMEEAKALVAGGVKELILVAQDTTLYGQDLDGRLRLPELLGALNALPDLHWIRVLYCYPKNFTDELIDAFAKYDKVCKYIDLPLQHVSDDLLKRMNRHDSKAQIENLLSKLRARIAGVNIRTTFIVGFPGETEEDFAILKEFVGDGKFDCAGVF